jgi:hypothetical protein
LYIIKIYSNLKKRKTNLTPKRLKLDRKKERKKTHCILQAWPAILKKPKSPDPLPVKTSTPQSSTHLLCLRALRTDKIPPPSLSHSKPQPLKLNNTVKNASKP